MRKRNGNFARMMRKLEKGNCDDLIPASSEAWGGEHTGYGVFLGLLLGEYDTSDYFDRARILSGSERQACIAARRHLMPSNVFDSVGMHVNNPDSIRKAVEYFERNPVGRRQDAVQESSDRE